MHIPFMTSWDDTVCALTSACSSDDDCLSFKVIDHFGVCFNRKLCKECWAEMSSLLFGVNMELILSTLRRLLVYSINGKSSADWGEILIMQCYSSWTFDPEMVTPNSPTFVSLKFVQLFRLLDHKARDGHFGFTSNKILYLCELSSVTARANSRNCVH